MIILNQIRKKSSREVTKVAISIINLQNIKKAFNPKVNLSNEELKVRILRNIYDLFYVQKQSEDDKINLYCFHINYKMEVKKNQYGRKLLFLYKSFYSISKTELLVLKKYLETSSIGGLSVLVIFRPQP